MERTAIDEIVNMNSRNSKGSLETAIKYIQRDIAEINNKLDDKYVTKDEFQPVKNLVYGLVGLILISVIGAILTLVLRK